MRLIHSVYVLQGFEKVALLGRMRSGYSYPSIINSRVTANCMLQTRVVNTLNEGGGCCANTIIGIQHYLFNKTKIKMQTNTQTTFYWSTLWSILHFPYPLTHLRGTPRFKNNYIRKQTPLVCGFKHIQMLVEPTAPHWARA